MSRMARNPAAVIIERRIRWRNEKACSGDEGGFATGGGLTALTLPIVPFRRCGQSRVSPRSKWILANHSKAKLRLIVEKPGASPAADHLTGGDRFIRPPG